MASHEDTGRSRRHILKAGLLGVMGVAAESMGTLPAEAAKWRLFKHHRSGHCGRPKPCAPPPCECPPSYTYCNGDICAVMPAGTSSSSSGTLYHYTGRDCMSTGTYYPLTYDHQVDWIDGCNQPVSCADCVPNSRILEQMGYLAGQNARNGSQVAPAPGDDHLFGPCHGMSRKYYLGVDCGLKTLDGTYNFPSVSSTEAPVSIKTYPFQFLARVGNRMIPVVAYIADVTFFHANAWRTKRFGIGYEVSGVASSTAIDATRIANYLAQVHVSHCCMKILTYYQI